MSRRSARRLLGIGAVITAVVAVTSFAWAGRTPSMAGSIEVAPPGHVDLERFHGLRVFFGHQSVGWDVLNGLGPVFARGGVPAPRVVESRTPPSSGPYVAHAFIGENGDPESKFRDFTKIMSGPMGDAVDVAMMKLCYTDVVASTDVDRVFDAYSATMSEIERAHPGIRLVYVTVPLTTDRGRAATFKAWLGQDDHMGPADNVARQRFNTLMRERYASTGRLFDIAAVEATMARDPAVRTDDGGEYLVLNRALSADAGHLNDLGSRAAATELVRVVDAAAGPRA